MTPKKPSKLSKLFPVLSNAKGSAIGFVMGMLLIIGLILYQIVPMSLIYSSIAGNIRNDLYAYNTAMAAFNLQLLRFNIFFRVKAMVRNNPSGPISDIIGESDDLIKPIWEFPFSFPLPDTLTASLGMGQKESIEDFKKTSSLKGRFDITATSSGGKLNINDVLIGNAEGNVEIANDPQLQQAYQKFSEELQKIGEDAITNIIQNKIDNDDAFRKKYPKMRPENLVNAIKDYIDEDDSRRDGGSEQDHYNEWSGKPANRPFINISELHQVEYIDDDLYDDLSSKFTVSFTRTLNPNDLDEKMFMALIPQAKLEEVQALIKKREDEEEGHGGDWPDPKAFSTDLEQLITTFPEGGAKWVEMLQKLGIEIVCKTNLYNIQINSEYAGTKRSIKALIMDSTEEEPLKGSGAGSGTTAANGQDSEPASTDSDKPDGKKEDKKPKPKIILDSLKRPPFILNVEIN